METETVEIYRDNGSYWTVVKTNGTADAATRRRHADKEAAKAYANGRRLKMPTGRRKPGKVYAKQMTLSTHVKVKMGRPKTGRSEVFWWVTDATKEIVMDFAKRHGVPAGTAVDVIVLNLDPHKVNTLLQGFV